MTTLLPALGHRQPDSVFAWVNGRAVSAAQFLHQGRRLAAQLPPARHVLNLCADRYHFAVTLLATLLRQQITLLPSTRTPAVIAQLRQFAADAYAVVDGAAESIDLPSIDYTRLATTDLDSAPGDDSWQVPQIDAGQCVAYVFTSGSTGLPVPHAKHFGRLVACVRHEAQRLLPPGVSGPESCAVLATVPAQHMYGFESSVLMPMQSGAALCSAQPFFPEDIERTLQQLPRPRLLITTPLHLRGLVARTQPPPAVDLIVSATAALPVELAHATEARYGAPLLEIYGATESGQVATRRPCIESQWHLWPEVHLRVDEAGRAWIGGGHVPESTLMADILEPVGSGTFLLHGRTADLVNIGGKRSSLAYLDHQLLAIPGVEDAAFVMPDGAENDVVPRLAALVVAPGLQPGQIIAALRERIDAVFLPRPLLQVPRLPRNATGKLPREQLRALLAESLARTGASS